jgi:hypothetical protein
MYGSTCFGRPHAHHQQLNNFNSSLWFYRWSVVVAVLLVVVVPPRGYQGTSSKHYKSHFCTACISKFIMQLVLIASFYSVFAKNVLRQHRVFFCGAATQRGS